MPDSWASAQERIEAEIATVQSWGWKPALSIPPADCTNSCISDACDCSGEYRPRAWAPPQVCGCGNELEKADIYNGGLCCACRERLDLVPPEGCTCASFWSVRQKHKKNCPLSITPAAAGSPETGEPDG